MYPINNEKISVIISATDLNVEKAAKFISRLDEQSIIT